MGITVALIVLVCLIVIIAGIVGTMSYLRRNQTLHEYSRARSTLRGRSVQRQREEGGTVLPAPPPPPSFPPE